MVDLNIVLKGTLLENGVIHVFVYGHQIDLFEGFILKFSSGLRGTSPFRPTFSKELSKKYNTDEKETEHANGKIRRKIIKNGY